MLYSIDYFCTSHIGKLRGVNQDNFICLGEYMEPDGNKNSGMISGRANTEEDPLFGIFDGMGGEECGEVASYLAAQCIAGHSFRGNVKRKLKEYCRVANGAICAYTDEHGLTSMGTTAAILLFTKKRIHLCNIGDSKIFRLNGGEMDQISYDHVGVSAYGSKPPLLQNLGIKESEMIIEPFIDTWKYKDQDIYLICSDGLTDMVDTKEICQTILSSEKEKAAEILLQKALDNGGKDNITIILLYINKTDEFCCKTVGAQIWVFIKNFFQKQWDKQVERS